MCSKIQTNGTLLTLLFYQTAFLMELKKYATNAHFCVIITVIILQFTKPEYVWPYGLAAVASTLLAAVTIPPFGLIDPMNEKKADAGGAKGEKEEETKDSTESKKDK